jgi:hypothetical protein
VAVHGVVEEGCIWIVSACLSDLVNLLLQLALLVAALLVDGVLAVATLIVFALFLLC